MKASDKICVAPHQIFDYDLDIQEVGHNGAEDYIRKDALLDWIKDQLKENAEWREVNPDDRFFGGKEVAFEHLIDKINSL